MSTRRRGVGGAHGRRKFIPCASVLYIKRLRGGGGVQGRSGVRRKVYACPVMYVCTCVVFHHSNCIRNHPRHLSFVILMEDINRTVYSLDNPFTVNPL